MCSHTSKHKSNSMQVIEPYVKWMTSLFQNNFGLYTTQTKDHDPPMMRTDHSHTDHTHKHHTHFNDNNSVRNDTHGHRRP